MRDITGKAGVAQGGDEPSSPDELSGFHRQAGQRQRHQIGVLPTDLVQFGCCVSDLILPGIAPERQNLLLIECQFTGGSELFLLIADVPVDRHSCDAQWLCEFPHAATSRSARMGRFPPAPADLVPVMRVDDEVTAAVPAGVGIPSARRDHLPK